MVRTPKELVTVLGPDGAALGPLPDLERGRMRELFVHMARVRCVDDRMLKLQRAGRVGFVGTARGLEAAMIGSAAVVTVGLARCSPGNDGVNPPNDEKSKAAPSAPPRTNCRASLYRENCNLRSPP